MSTIQDIAPEAIGAGTTMVSGIVGWFAGTRKRKREQARAELEEIQKVATFWKNMADSFEKKANKLLEEMERLRNQNAELLENQRQLKRENGELKKSNADLKLSMASLEHKINELQNPTRP